MNGIITVGNETWTFTGLPTRIEVGDTLYIGGRIVEATRVVVRVLSRDVLIECKDAGPKQEAKAEEVRQQQGNIMSSVRRKNKRRA